MNNKKGKMNGAVAVFLVVGVLFMLGFGYLGYRVAFPSQQSILAQQTSLTPEEANRVVTTVTSGAVATLKLTAEDRGLRSSTVQLAMPAYCTRTSPNANPNSILGGQSGTTLSATTSTSIGGVARGDTLSCTVFNSTYVGTAKTITMDTESKSEKIDAYRTTGVVRVTPFDENDQTGSGALAEEFAFNVSVGVNGEQTFRLKVENNVSNTIYRLGAIAFDLPGTSNISEITVNEGVDQNGLGDTSPISLTRGTMPTRLSSSDYNWIFYFKQGNNPYVELGENDWVKSGTFKLRGDGDGCPVEGTNPIAETITYAVIDNHPFQKLSGDDRGSLSSGVEDDAPSPADVGRSDVTRTIRCWA